MRRARSIMIQGTGSGVGKSLIAAGLCRILSDMGVNVAPFKAQNMALNSYVTVENGEIGRAQALQAEAARVDAETDMNPVLLKTQSDSGCQVILNGRVHGSMTAREYYAFRETAWKTAASAYDRLASRYEAIVLEGAGSPAEINLAREEIVNMNMARHAESPVILVGDIDKGGVFASLFGTVALLNGDADLIRAFIINKFRGDFSILAPGLDTLFERTGRPVLGVLPHLGDPGLHEEDGIPASRIHTGHADREIRVAIVRLRSISNFTDFDPFLHEPDVDISYTLRASDFLYADAVIIPGSKNTVKDLLHLRELGLDRVISSLALDGKTVVGICGGYQMLGEKILDPHGMESPHPEVPGLGLLPVTTTLTREKTTRRSRAAIVSPPPGIFHPFTDMAGYEIHLGDTESPNPLFRLDRGDGEKNEKKPDGAANGSVWGTYLHGIFDHDGFRRSFLDALRAGKELAPISSTVSYAAVREKAIDAWADTLRRHLDMDFIIGLMGLKK